MALADFGVKDKPQWCLGCGDFGILMGIKSSINELQLNPKDVVLVSDIGCQGKIPHYINTYGYEGLHGRALPLGSGIKIANRKLTVLVMAGDGGGYGEGVQHFVHICRRNYDLTYIVHNNEIYGLTTGQASPTTKKDLKTKTSPFGNHEVPFNPMASAIVQGATFVARTWAGDMKHMKEIIMKAIKHKGFALVDVFQPCVTFNKNNSYEWYQQRVYDLQQAGYNQNDKLKALEKAYEEQATNFEKVPIGIFYEEQRQTFEETLPQIEKEELVDQSLDNIDVSELCKDLM
ncbi:MAG TPA: thiamine pyrophosphate-dependent enzyme [Candidatus Bilamarchaeaceae archaeon]|nr:thiamine pyrophosphate-dependent enzyme [Candidatus Bilamarchaeaceae archaeon]